jgi:hypothetical protein
MPGTGAVTILAIGHFTALALVLAAVLVRS